MDRAVPGRDGAGTGRRPLGSSREVLFPGGWTRVAAGEVVGRRRVLTRFESRATGFSAVLDMGYTIKSRVKEFLILSLCVYMRVCVRARARTLCSVMSDSLRPHEL